MSPISSRNSVPPFGHLETAGLGRHRTRERTLLVAEELALEQRLRQRACRDGHERLRRPVRQVVDGARDELLARAGLAVDHHGRAGRRDLSHRLEHVEHPRVRGHDALDVVVLLELFAKPFDLGRQLPILEGLLDGELELLEVERLGQVLARARLHGFDRGGDVAVCGQHDDRERCPLTAHAPQDLHAVGLGHPVVENHDVGLLLGDSGQRLLAVCGLDHLEAFGRERLAEHPRMFFSSSTMRILLTTRSFPTALSRPEASR